MRTKRTERTNAKEEMPEFHLSLRLYLFRNHVEVNFQENLILRFHFIDVLFAVWRAVECKSKGKSLHICQLHNGIFNCILS